MDYYVLQTISHYFKPLLNYYMSWLNWNLRCLISCLPNDNLAVSIQLFVRPISFHLHIQVSPEKGTVGFGSGLHGWAFSLKQFAEIYATKFKIEPKKLMNRLWGSNFYNAKERKWKKDYYDGYVRGFNQFVLDPIYKVFQFSFGSSLFCIMVT